MGTSNGIASARAARGVTAGSMTCFRCSCCVLSLVVATHGFVTSSSLSFRARIARGQAPERPRKAGRSLSMIIPRPEEIIASPPDLQPVRVVTSTLKQTDHDGGLGTAHVIKVPEGRYLSPNVLIAAVAEATDVDHSLHFCASHDHRWNYVHEGVDDHPDYIANLNVPGESKPGATQEAYPAEELPLDDFVHGGAFVSDFHDIPVLDRPCYQEMKQFIIDEGLAMLPEETELLERDIQMERKKRAEARKERFADEPDEDLVDDTLDDVPVGTDVDSALPSDAPTVDFDDNDGYDDGYDTPGDTSTIPDSSASDSVF